MKSVVRQLILLAVSAVISWFLFLGEPPPFPYQDPPEPAPPVAVRPSIEHPPVEAQPMDEPAPAAPTEVAQAEPEKAEPVETEPAPQPEEAAPLAAEAGTRDSQEEEGSAGDTAAITDEQAQAAEESEPAQQEPTETEKRAEAQRVAEEERKRTRELMQNPELLEAAKAEFSGERRHGFTTVFLAAPEEQLEIARTFGEEVVLVPKKALDPENTNPRYYRLDLGSMSVIDVEGRPPLERFRQYRDLFSYEYLRLSDPIRDLRRKVVSRRDIYVFAALIPLEEWALVIARRAEALAKTGRPMEDVERFVVRYVNPGDWVDLEVEEIVFADGSRYRPE